MISCQILDVSLIFSSCVVVARVGVLRLKDSLGCYGPWWVCNLTFNAVPCFFRLAWLLGYLDIFKAPPLLSKGRGGRSGEKEKPF